MIHYSYEHNNWAVFAELEHGDTFFYNDEPYLCAEELTDEDSFMRGINLLYGRVEDFSGSTLVKRVDFELKEVR